MSNCTGEDVLKVKVVNPGDGTSMLVDTTRLLARMLQEGRISRDEINTEFIDRLLQGMQRYCQHHTVADTLRSLLATLRSSQAVD